MIGGMTGVVLTADHQSQTRLTYNYWRKGGYGIGHEDYRWYGCSTLSTCVLREPRADACQGNRPSTGSQSRVPRLQLDIHLVHPEHLALHDLCARLHHPSGVNHRAQCHQR